MIKMTDYEVEIAARRKAIASSKGSRMKSGQQSCTALPGQFPVYCKGAEPTKESFDA